MIPTKENLEALINKQITLDVKLGCQPASGVIEKEYGVSLTGGDSGSLTRDDDGGDGTWVPYAEGKAVVGYLRDGISWIASGPFSGCKFSVGKDGSGKVFAAHIAQQSGSTGEEDYSGYRGTKSLSEWYWNKIPLPEVTVPNSLGACSYIFVILKDDKSGIESMNRVDVNSPQMGSGNGTVTAVHTFK